MADERSVTPKPKRGINYKEDEFPSFHGYKTPSEESGTKENVSPTTKPPSVTPTPPAILITQEDPPLSNSDAIKQIVSRQDTFDNSIAYPSEKRRSDSPETAANTSNLVTPDQLFGPTSPKRSDSYSGGLETETEDLHGRNLESRLGTAHQVSDDKDWNTKPQSEDNSPTNSESPLRSHSVFTPLEKDGADFNKLFHSSGSLSKNKESKDSRNEQERLSKMQGNVGETNSAQNPSNSPVDRSRSQNSDKNEPTLSSVSPTGGRVHHQGSSNWGSPSRASSYDHGHILDENLQISDSKLDSTLLKYFSDSSPNSTGKASNLSDSGRHGSPLGKSQSDFIGMEPVMWRVHPMTATQKETLERESDFIAFHVKPRVLVSKLYQDGILTAMDYNQLSRTEPQGEKAVTRLLIKTLQRRGAKAYPALLDALLANDYPLVCERLSETDRALKNGIAGDRSENDWARDVYTTFSTPNAFGITAPNKATSPTFMSGYASPLQHYPAQTGGFSSTNRFSPLGHMPPLYSGRPANQMGGSIADPNYLLEQRVSDLSAGVRTLHEDIMALRSGRPISPWPASPLHTSSLNHIAGSNNRGMYMTPDGRMINVFYVEQELAALEGKLAELMEYLAALRAARPTVSGMPPMMVPNIGHPGIDPNKANPQGPGQSSPAAGQRATYPPQLEQHLSDMMKKLKALHEDVNKLKEKRKNSDSDRAVPDYLLREKKESPNRRTVDAGLLDGHLKDLRREINLLHDDVTALKRSRTPYSNRSRRDYDPFRYDPKPSPSRYYDDYDSSTSYRSPARRSRSPDYVMRSYDSTYADGPSGLTPFTTRYPSRYSPVDGFKSYRDNGPKRSPSRTDNVANRDRWRGDSRSPSRNSRDQDRKSYGNRNDYKPESTKNSDTYPADANRKNDDRDYRNRDGKRSPDYRDDYRNKSKPSEDNNRRTPGNDAAKPYSERDDKPYKPENKGIYPNEDTPNDKRSNPKNDRAEHKPMQNADQPSKEDARLYNSADPSKSHPSNKNDRSNAPVINKNDKSDSNAPVINKNDKSGSNAPVNNKNDKSDSNASPYSSQNDNTPYHNNNNNNNKSDREQYPKTNKEKAYPSTSTEEKPQPQPSTSKQDDKTPASTSGQPRDNVGPLYSQRPPESQNPQKATDKDPDAPESHSSPSQQRQPPYRNPSSRGMTPLDTIEEGSLPESKPKLKKRVSYSDMLHPGDDEPQHLRPTRSRNSPRPVSVAGSTTSDGGDRKWMTTPTRVLSPPSGTKHERVTTPYKILRSPYKRRITTWSKNPI